MANDNFTLMIVPPEVNARVRRAQVPRRALYAGALVAIGLVGGLFSVFVHYAYVIDQVFEARSLRDENGELKGRIAVLQAKVDDVDTRLAQLRLFDQRLRKMTDLHDEERGLAMGPLRAVSANGETAQPDLDPFAIPVAGDDPSIQGLRQALLDSRLAGLATEASLELDSMAELVDYFGSRESQLQSTPAIAPVRGLMTSGFGAREDPFTGGHTMHSGLDIAADEGAKVLSPANGVVVFAGEMPAYGNCIRVDHGRDISTLYGHLSRILVKAGDTIQRGQHIGNVGNTGRSTGPHLHYEVRKSNIPVNPRPFILH